MKKIMFVMLPVILIVIIIILCNMNNNQIRYFNNKISIMKEYINNNEEYKNLVKNTVNNGVVISISDGNTKAIVKYSKKNNIEEDFKNSVNQLKRYIQKNRYTTQWVKIDFINNVQSIKVSNLEEALNNYTIDDIIQYGMMFESENSYIILTKEELNSNDIINYQENSINKDNLNTYLDYLGVKKINQVPDKIYFFDTISFFCDEKNVVYSLLNSGIDTGRRKIDMDKQQVKQVINSSRDYLCNMIQENGKFIYGYEPIKDAETDGYSIIRHAGSIWSLILTYDKDADKSEIQKEKITKAIDYLIKSTVYPNEEIAYIKEDEEIALGGNALASVAICEYINKFGNNDKYIEIAKKLGNGIINMQNEDGHFVHILNPYNYEILANYRSVFYDGEATLALAKLYGITKDKKYLEAAEKAMDYFIENNYLTYKDHWLSYAANEITKYSPKEKYFEFGLKNVGENKQQLLDTNSTSHTDFELLMQCYELYERMEKEGINIDYAKLTKQDLEKYIKERAYVQLNTYLYPEKAMYLSNPSKYVNTFCIIKSNYRIRIDDIQHSITGYYYYLKTQ